MESEWIEWGTTHFVYIFFWNYSNVSKNRSHFLYLSKFLQTSTQFFLNQFVVIEKLPLSSQVYSSLFYDVDFVIEVLFTTKEVWVWKPVTKASH